MTAKTKYGHINSLKDITAINDKIRSSMKKDFSKKTLTQSKLTKYVRESRYLLTLSHTLRWKSHFRKLKIPIGKVRSKIKSEYCKTSKLANNLAIKIKAQPIYSESIKYCNINN